MKKTEKKVKALSIEELKLIVGKNKTIVSGDCCTTTGKTLMINGSAVNPADVTPIKKK